MAVAKLALAATGGPMRLNPEHPKDLINYGAIAAVAHILASGNEDEWSYFLNSLVNGCKAIDADYVNLFLKVRDEIKARLDGPVTPAEFYGEPSPFGDLLPNDKGDIPDVFRTLFDDQGAGNE